MIIFIDNKMMIPCHYTYLWRPRCIWS